MIGDESYWLHLVTRVVEIAETAIIVVGAFGALALLLAPVVSGTAARERLVAEFRSNLGRSILLGLEFLATTDIINTVAVEPTIEGLLVLAGIVLIRTVLSFSLEVAIEGRWPWQRGRSDPRTVDGTGSGWPSIEGGCGTAARLQIGRLAECLRWASGRSRVPLASNRPNSATRTTSESVLPAASAVLAGI